MKSTSTFPICDELSRADILTEPMSSSIRRNNMSNYMERVCQKGKRKTGIGHFFLLTDVTRLITRITHVTFYMSDAIFRLLANPILFYCYIALQDNEGDVLILCIFQSNRIYKEILWSMTFRYFIIVAQSVWFLIDSIHPSILFWQMVPTVVVLV